MSDPVRLALIVVTVLGLWVGGELLSGGGGSGGGACHGSGYTKYCD